MTITTFRAALALGFLVVAPLRYAGAAESFPPWSGREERIETILLLGEPVEQRRIGHGITNPWKVTLEHEGERLLAVWKPLPEDSFEGYSESYRAEVAAYRLSRYLGLDRVPPTVLRRVRGRNGSMQLWVDGFRTFADVHRDGRSPAPGWSDEIARMRFFDVLIQNLDRNAGNFLVDDQWRIVLIDHSRALALPQLPDPRLMKKRPTAPMRYDRRLVEATRELDLEALEPLLGDLYSKAQLRTLLEQRDELVEAAAKAERLYGEVVFGVVRTPGTP